MKLKRVEIQGFKSFVNRTVLEFHSGVTAVVGPNGCGKSNLVDSIRWVLGENNARTLRGGIMEDVIFSGTDSRPPHGMAEVTLTILNDDGSAPAQYSSLSEIAVTRRVFRDGNSEYLINKTPCRLKDITDIFMGTGANFYSVVEQGKIASVVSAKPDDLRLFIEEAAGITFYRSRKRAAVRRIEATQKNLLRVSDILSEISRQIKYLERQARKAEQYREYRDELRELELNIANHEIATHGENLKTKQAIKEEINLKLTGAQSSSESFSAEIENKRLDLHEKEQNVQKAQKELFEAGKTLAEKENRHEYLQREITELGERRKSTSEEVERSRIKMKIAKEELERGAAELEELRSKNETHRDRLEVLEQERNTLADELEHYRHEGTSLHQHVVEHVERITTIKNQLSAVEEEDARSMEEASKWLQERERLNDEIEMLSNQEAQDRQQKENLDSELEQLESKIHALESDIQEGKSKQAQLQRQREELKLAQAEAKSRFDSLVALMSEEDAVQFVHFAEQQGWSTLKGTLAQHIKVDARFEHAVESLLKDRLQWVVVNEDSTATFMRGVLQGDTLPPRTTVVPSAIKKAIHIDDEWLNHPDVRGSIAGMISCDPELRPLVEYLCAGALLVDDLAAAERVSEKLKTIVDAPMLVTQTGELVKPGAETTAGSTKANEEGILKRQREIDSLENKVRVLGEQIQKVETDGSQLEDSLTGYQAELEQSKQKRQEKQMRRVHLEKDIERCSGDVTKLKARIESLEHEHTSVLSRYESLKEKQDVLRADLTKAEQERGELASKEEELTALVEETQDKLNEAEETLTLTRVDNASSLEREENLQQEQVRLNQDIEHLNENEARFAAEVDQLWRREQEAQNQLEDLDVGLEQERGKVVTLEEVFQEKQNTYQEAQSELQRLDISRREADAETNQLTKRLSEIEIEVRELQAKREHTRDIMIEKWKVDLFAVTPATDVEVTDETREQAKELRDKIEKMGEVNLGAVEEHQFLEERFEFLSTQKNDLEESLNKLNRTIRKIDQTTRKLFFEAFDGINKELQKTFPTLFRGGKAELLLTGDEDKDPLERGMTIIARPPGKRPQNINLLSGGEKSLTAAALIFAIFRFKPTPFSILDEVDAALDDENTRRLNTMAQEISGKSQLIIITHNKTTMEIAQNLYGITMEEPGITKIVSVRLDETERTSDSSKRGEVATTTPAVA